MILDEPTSLIDSWGVIDWFDRFRKLAAGRTSILITHSLTIAKNADLIYVMNSGKIVESGTHGELLSIRGRYADSWHEQFRMNPEAGLNKSPYRMTDKVFVNIDQMGDGLKKVS
jgi:ABC-type multidrug transport system fused ATPase/permease subunit